MAPSDAGKEPVPKERGTREPVWRRCAARRTGRKSPLLTAAGKQLVDEPTPAANVKKFVKP